MNDYIEYFTNYVYKNYDMNNKLISLKYYHSLRVAKLMMILSKKMSLSEDDISLAFKIGICHDLGRFYEVVLNGKFDNLKFDHGAYSNKILYNDGFINYMNIDEHLLFRKAIFYHNKQDIKNDLSNRELLFAKMIRDMDKIDILKVRSKGNKLNIANNPTLNVINNYNNKQTINIADIHNSTDSTILYLSFIKDLYFNASFDMAINYEYLDQLLSIINVPEEKQEIWDSIINKLYEEGERRYVRKKI